MNLMNFVKPTESKNLFLIMNARIAYVFLLWILILQNNQSFWEPCAVFIACFNFVSGWFLWRVKICSELVAILVQKEALNLMTNKFWFLNLRSLNFHTKWVQDNRYNQKQPMTICVDTFNRIYVRSGSLQAITAKFINWR